MNTELSLPQTAPGAASVTVRRGDTLVGLVKAHYRGQGVTVDDRQAFLMALRVAKGNGISDAARIQPGQTVRFDALPAATELASRGGVPAAAAAAPASTADVLPARQSNPVFERTLARAVERGFVPAADADAVRERVDRMAQAYGFDPDDFARVVLIESDGMNPGATNGKCHGIIQFCGGPGRGAASVGFANNAQDIGKLSVLQQLDLVDRYFQDVGMPRAGTRMSLDDLYLSVLTPAARATRTADAPLPIPGTQARVLYEGGQRDAPITRRSITQGLLRYAQERLTDVATQVTSQISSATQVPSQMVSQVSASLTGASGTGGTGTGAGSGSGSASPAQRQLIAANLVEKP